MPNSRPLPPTVAQQLARQMAALRAGIAAAWRALRH